MLTEFRAFNDELGFGWKTAGLHFIAWVDNQDRVRDVESWVSSALFDHAKMHFCGIAFSPTSHTGKMRGIEITISLQKNKSCSLNKHDKYFGLISLFPPAHSVGGGGVSQSPTFLLVFPIAEWLKRELH